jgi:branched-chain amino acid aminotransferase
MQQFVNNNGVFVEAESPVITHRNRAFCYGDALFETIRITNNKPQFLKEHIQRLHRGMGVFKMDIHTNISEDYFDKAIKELAAKNGIGSDARVRLTVYRNEGGLYTPETNSVSFLIEVTHIEEKGYLLNNKGYTVDLFTEFNKPKNVLSTIKSANCAIYVLAGLYKKSKGLDDCLLVNDKGYIIESISSNIFAVKNGVLYTAPIADGCVEGVMRKKIMEVAAQNRIAVQEVSVLQNILLSSDELFLTNTIQGIRWVVAYKQKRYFNNTSKILTEKLNEFVLGL